MNTIEKIEKGYFNLNKFSKEQVNFIKGLMKLAYDDGVEDGKAEIKNKVWNAIEVETD